MKGETNGASSRRQEGELRRPTPSQHSPYLVLFFLLFFLLFRAWHTAKHTAKHSKYKISISPDWKAFALAKRSLVVCAAHTRTDSETARHSHSNTLASREPSASRRCAVRLAAATAQLPGPAAAEHGAAKSLTRNEVNEVNGVREMLSTKERYVRFKRRIVEWQKKQKKAAGKAHNRASLRAKKKEKHLYE